ncbi:hypothetical protein [Sporisorium scitamineum]|uniref:Uncharacterized protein n=1 Tax=Sporisorium scitamineum TaxID=49012 RepID=A0A0F7RTX2_9BASI|nr:hypothetical protein [Sporisorium scitamineum]
MSINNWSVPTLDEVLALPWFSDMYRYEWQDISANATQAWECNGFCIWADILWYNNLAQGLQEYPHANSAPLVPPSASGIKSNYMVRPSWPSTYLPFSHASGLVLHMQWNSI